MGECLKIDQNPLAKYEKFGKIDDCEKDINLLQQTRKVLIFGKCRVTI